MDQSMKMITALSGLYLLDFPLSLRESGWIWTFRAVSVIRRKQ